MINLKTAITSAIVATALSLSSAAIAAAPDSYQVTGTVKSVTDTVITVVKGKENFEIARTADTKVTGEVAVGSKVTVQYTMTATNIDVKAAKTKKNDTKKTAPAAATATPKAA